MSRQQQSTQLDDMLRKTFERADWTKFLALSRHKVRRLRKAADNPTKNKRIEFWKLLKRLPEIKQQQRIAERVKQREGNANDTTNTIQ